MFDSVLLDHCNSVHELVWFLAHREGSVGLLGSLYAGHGIRTSIFHLHDRSPQPRPHVWSHFPNRRTAAFQDHERRNGDEHRDKRRSWKIRSEEEEERIQSGQDDRSYGVCLSYFVVASYGRQRVDRNRVQLNGVVRVSRCRIERRSCQ